MNATMTEEGCHAKNSWHPHGFLTCEQVTSQRATRAARSDKSPLSTTPTRARHRDGAPTLAHHLA